MERDLSNGKGRPPAMIGRLIRLLIPPPAREAVMGDLEERYSSPLQYASEGMRAVPYLVASRARRTSSIPVIGLQFFILVACLGVTLPDHAGQEAPSWAQGGIPALAALAALVLRNVYSGEEPPLKRGLIDAMTAAVAMLLSQAALAGLVVLGAVEPAWLLPEGLYKLGFFALPVLWVLGAAEGRDESARAPGAPRRPAEAVVQDYMRFERRTRLRNRAEIVALGLVVAGSSMILLRFNPPMSPIAWPFMGLFTLLLIYLAMRGAAPPADAAGGFSAVRTLYGKELARQHGLRRLMWWFWLGPLFIGLAGNLVLFGLRIDQPLRVAVGGVAIILLAAFIIALNRNRGREVRDKIDALSAMVEPA